MNHTDVTPSDEGAESVDVETTEITLAEGGDIAHERIVRTVRWILDHSDYTQKELADLLGMDRASINRALLLEDKTEKQRRREWKATEVFRMALLFDLPVEVFFGTSVEEEWERRMADARKEHRALLRSLKDAE